MSASVPVRTEVVPFPLERAGEALGSFRGGEIGRGAVVIVVDEVR